MTMEADDPKGAKLGMWLFLYGEMLLFSGLFLLYAVYFVRYHSGFLTAGQRLNLVFGSINTIILLISSFFVAAALSAMLESRKRLAIWFLVMAVVIALIFLMNKYFEWTHEIHEGFYPGSATLNGQKPGVALFFNLYYAITGLHGVHVAIGAIALSITAILIKTGRISAQRPVILDHVGLYWHLVDLIWIFVFPLFYLVV